MENTIETLNEFATRMEADEQAERAKLQGLIRAYARILSVREPEQFAPMPLEYGDVAGHWDNSFPPKQEYRERCGPRLLVVVDCKTDDLPTSSGYYYSWRRVTEDPGLFIDREGQIWGCDESGTGRVGQYAAHPGDCDVEIAIDYTPRSEVSVAHLREVEQHLRAAAFPLAGAA